MLRKKEADKVYFRQLEEALFWYALALLGDFRNPDIYWRVNAAKDKKFRNFLECTDDNFLTQVTEEPKRGEALLLLTLPQKNWLGM